MKNLKINQSFRATFPKRSRRDYKLLEEDILLHGCQEPIEVHDETIIDGHLRYEICKKHGLPFQTKRMN